MQNPKLFEFVCKDEGKELASYDEKGSTLTLFTKIENPDDIKD